MTTILVDHDMEGQAVVLRGSLAAEGWLDLLPLQLITLADAGLPIESDDRKVWRFCQENQMLLLTNNRSMKDPDALEQVIREENTESSWPVLTVGNSKRMYEREYREACAVRLLEIVMNLQNYFGAGRVYIP